MVELQLVVAETVPVAKAETVELDIRELEVEMEEQEEQEAQDLALVLAVPEETEAMLDRPVSAVLEHLVALAARTEETVVSVVTAEVPVWQLEESVVLAEPAALAAEQPLEELALLVVSEELPLLLQEVSVALVEPVVLELESESDRLEGMPLTVVPEVVESVVVPVESVVLVAQLEVPAATMVVMVVLAAKAVMANQVETTPVVMAVMAVPLVPEPDPELPVLAELVELEETPAKVERLVLEVERELVAVVSLEPMACLRQHAPVKSTNIHVCI